MWEDENLHGKINRVRDTRFLIRNDLMTVSLSGLVYETDYSPLEM